jgi:hypothetical protein
MQRQIVRVFTTQFISKGSVFNYTLSMYLQQRTQQKQDCLAYNIVRHTDRRISENRYFASKEHVLGH